MSLFLCIATVTRRGIARGCRVPDLIPKKANVTPTFKVCHVGIFRQHERLFFGSSVTHTVFSEEANLAEFDGPLCVKAAEQFIEMMKKGLTPDSRQHCATDGPVPLPPKKWTCLTPDKIQIIDPIEKTDPPKYLPAQFFEHI